VSGRVLFVNWGWMRLRWQHIRHCPGAFVPGDRKGRRACSKCGVWFWHPVHIRIWPDDPEAKPRWWPR
jgi:hypothetical protein